MKKFLSFIFSICLIIPCAFILSACGGDGEDPGCQHNWNIKTQPTTEIKGKATCGLCAEVIELPKLDASNYQVNNTNPDYVIYNYNKSGASFNFYSSNFVVIEGEYGGYEIAGYLGDSSSVVIPENIMGENGEASVTAIANEAFLNNTTITSVTLPHSVKAIKYNVFGGCTNLSYINLFEGLQIIGPSAFEGCGFTEIDMPNSLIRVGADSFKNCKLLEKVVLNNSIYEIEEGAFQGCTSLVDVNLGTSCEIIYEDVFRDCTNLEEIILPATITIVSDSSFRGCDKLDKVYFMGTKGNCYFDDEFEDSNYADLCFYLETEPTVDDKVAIAEGVLMWHYDTDNNKVFWQATKTNNVYGKDYELFKTEVTITEEYWNLLKAANDATLNEMFNSDQVEIYKVKNSDTKQEYETKLSVAKEYCFIYFDDLYGDGWITISTEEGSTSYSYCELDNTVYYNDSWIMKEISINLSDNTITRVIEEENMTIKHTYKIRVIEE